MYQYTSTMAMTQSKADNIKAEWSKIANEDLELQVGTFMDDPIFAFGSSDAVLNLLRYYNGNGQTGWSESKQKWYFVINSGVK